MRTNSLVYNWCMVKLNLSDFWKTDKVTVFDPLNEMRTGIDDRNILQYLYDEGFIQDRRTECVILSG